MQTCNDPTGEGSVWAPQQARQEKAPDSAQHQYRVTEHIISFFSPTKADDAVKWLTSECTIIERSQSSPATA